MAADTTAAAPPAGTAHAHSAPAGVWEWEGSGRQVRCDAAIREMFGLAASDFCGALEGWLQCLFARDPGRRQAILAAIGSGKDEYQLTFPLPGGNSLARLVESRGLIRRDASGAVLRVIGVERDVTPRDDTARQLILLNERLQLALRSAKSGVWELDLATNRLVWDDRMLEIYGVRREEFDDSRSIWIRCVHPEDFAKVEAARLQAVSGEAANYTIDFRITRPDGSVRFIEGDGYIQRDAHHRPVRLVGVNRDVTEEREMRAALQVTEQRWQLAIEGTNDAVWDWDVKNNLMYHDRRWTAMLGYDEHETFNTVEGWRRLVHPEDMAAGTIAYEEHVAQRRAFYQHELRLREKSGGWKWILTRGKIVARDADGQPLRMVGTHTDITERKNLEQRLRQVEELALQTSRLAKVGGWELDTATMNLIWSDGVRSIHEVDRSHEPTLQSALDFFPEEAREKLRTALADATLHGSAFNLELPLLTAQGARAWVRVLGRAELRNGKAVRILGAMQDITAEVESEQARSQLEIQLFQAQKMETLGTLAGGIAHDFNNLLTGIIGYHELAADSVPADHPARACLAEAHNASLRARELVEQILTFGRQHTATEQTPLDLELAIEEARRFLRATLPANISIRTKIAPGCSHVLADATQIHQVLLNLGSNAAHAMRAKGGTLEFSLQPFEVGTERGATLAGAPAGSYVRISVSDTGHGIDEPTLRRIFDPFFTTKNIREGTGLGLAVVHGIVRTHRGTIDVESQPGEGATFHIYLPAISQENSPRAAEPEAVTEATGLSVCVVDDENIVGQSTRMVLESKGYRVVVFTSAEQCLAAFQADPPSWDMVVTDQSMPGMQGTALAAAIRQQVPTMPIVLMSGYFSKISAHTLDELGHVVLLAKPFTADELIRTIHRALQPAPAEPA